MVINQIDWNSFFLTVSIVFLCQVFLLSLFCLLFFLFYVFIIFETFFEKLVAVSILNLSSVINFPPLKDILPVYSLPFLLADMYCNCKVALPLVCRCQVLQTKNLLCNYLWSKLSIFLFSSSSNTSFGASLVNCQ